MKKTKVNLDGGVYTDEQLKEEYEKYENGEESIIIGVQHFDFGCENLSIDITDYVKSLLGDIKLDYPVAYDWEIIKDEEARTDININVQSFDDAIMNYRKIGNPKNKIKEKKLTIFE